MLGPRSWLSPRNLLIALVLASALLAIAPTRYTLWTNRFGTIAQIVVEPVRAIFATVLRPAEKPLTATEELLHSKEQLDFITVRYLQLEAENRSLLRQIESLQQGVAINPDSKAPRVVTPVVGFSSNPASLLLKLRTDHVSKDQLTGLPAIGVGSVAVVNGVNVVGRVVSSGDYFAWVQPITDPSLIGKSGSSGGLAAAVYPNEGRTDLGAELWSVKYGVTLVPTVDGMLRGSVLRLIPGEETPLKVGMRVRLTVPPGDWPRFADNLVIGTVASIEKAANDRPEITVKPSFELRSLREVTVMIQQPVRVNDAEPKPGTRTKPGVGGGVS